MAGLTAAKNATKPGTATTAKDLQKPPITKATKNPNSMTANVSKATRKPIVMSATVPKVTRNPIQMAANASKASKGPISTAATVSKAARNPIVMTATVSQVSKKADSPAATAAAKDNQTATGNVVADATNSIKPEGSSNADTATATASKEAIDLSKLKPTTCAQAIKAWEKQNKEIARKAKVIALHLQWPPIEKMDRALTTLASCQKLSLSSNMINKINGLYSLKNLRLLSLARNNLRNLNGIECLSSTLEELWVSYNLIEKLKPLESMKALKVFYVSHNQIKEWPEFMRMRVPPKLQEITFQGNPLAETMIDLQFRDEAAGRLPNLKKLDFEPILRESASNK